MKKIVLFITASVVLLSCQPSQKDLLMKKWKGFSAENKQIDSMMRERENFLDTFGKNNDAATNLAMYGIANVDSVREINLALISESRKMQQHNVENTYLEITKDGLAIMSYSSEQRDSSKWRLDKNMLHMHDIRDTSIHIEMEILSLNDTMLKLKYQDNNGTSTVTFKPAAK
ncbi:MAG: hypothetical protein JST82_03615 [Bacteroidetes bacterium]|nr:hypothetical protein [Bacteroidota bacterium]